MPDLSRQPHPQPSPFAEPWPDGVTARYLTLAGATVDITGSGDRTYRACTGCPYGNGNGWWTEGTAHGDAQKHAERCRALPRPAVTA